MNLLRRLEDAALKAKIPPWVMGIASIPLAVLPMYAMSRQGDRAFDGIPDWLTFSLAAGVTFLGSKTYFDRRKSLKDLGIELTNENPKKTEKKWYWNLWDSWLMHPKISGAAIGTTLALSRTVFHDVASIPDLEERLALISSEISRHSSEGNLNAFLLRSAGTSAALSGILSFLSYHGVRYLSWMASSEGAPRSFAELKALLSRGEKGIETCKEMLEKYPSRQTALNLANEEIKRHNLEDAVRHIKQASKLPKEPFYPNMSESDFLFLHVEGLHGDWKKNKKNAVKALALATYASNFGSREAAAGILRQTAEEEGSAETSAIMAWWAGEAIGMPEESEIHWRDAFVRMHASPSYASQQVGEEVRGVNNVYQMGPEFIREDTILKEQSRYQTDFESKMLRFIEEQVPKDPSNSVPRELSRFSYENESARHVLVMAYTPGPNLFQKIEADSGLEDALRVTEYLATLHRHIPPEMSSLGTVDLKEKMRKAAANPALGMPEKEQESALRHLEFMLDRLQGKGQVLAQDAHGGQWLFPKELLIKVDHNDSGIDTLFRDLAKRDAHPKMNRLLFNGSASFHALQNETYRIYKDKGLAGKDEKDFRLLHLQAMLAQALSFASAWSAREMKHMHDLRTPALETAAGNVMEVLRSDHAREYASNRKNYQEIESAFRRQCEILKP